TASRGFGGHFSSTGLIWGETTRVNYYLKFEMALAKVQAKLGIIPQQAADEIAKFCAPNGGGIFGNRFGSIPYATLKESTELTGFSVVGVVQHIVKEVNSVKPRAALGEWAHWGASTQDVTDTATVLQLRDTLEIIQFELDNIMANLQELCKRYKTTPLPARSNLQQAVPISFGFKLARILATFQRHQDRLDDLCPRLLVLEFSGAAGTLATLLLTPEDPELGMDCQRLLAEELGLSVPDIAWHTERDSIAEFGSLCAQLTSTCSKFALDVKSMMQTEVGEVSEPYVSQRGSSTTMPHMMNPISCTHITAMASTVRHLSANLFDAMIADHERDSSSREIEGIVLPQISTLTCDILKMTKGLIEGLEVDEDRMKANLAITRGRIVSEAVMMKLGKIIGRQYAHEVIYEVCRKATLENRPLIELLCEHEEVSKEMKREELEKLCDPLRYLGYSAFMVDKVLK
ncbi:L-Aspartase-like protein, partial [Patellaria atrata CBS 101060]